MLEEKLISLIRTEMLDALVNEYCDSFSNVACNKVQDNSYLEIIKFWRSCDDKQQNTIRSIMRFSSQNSLGSLLALIDNSSFCYEASKELGIEEFKLTAETNQGEIPIKQDLSDIFWEQEQENGYVK